MMLYKLVYMRFRSILFNKSYAPDTQLYRQQRLIILQFVFHLSRNKFFWPWKIINQKDSSTNSMTKCTLFWIYLPGTNIVLEHFKKHNYGINYDTKTKMATIMPHDPDTILEILWKLPFITSFGSQFAVMSDLSIYMCIYYW